VHIIGARMNPKQISTENQVSKKPMKRQITRRSALKKIAAGTIGAAVATSLSARSRLEASEIRLPVSDNNQPYEPPRVAWREIFEPATAQMSCARQPGNPNCDPGPVTA